MNKIWIFSGNRPSNGAKELASQPGFKRLRTGNYLKLNDIIVNWGHSGHFQFHGYKILNNPTAVKVASNKLDAFELMQSDGVSVVPWTTNSDVLTQWQQKSCVIVGRQTLTGHSGHGIIIMEKNDPIQPALLYTKYIFKTKEYRVHVVGDHVVNTQVKIRDPDRVPISWKVRSHENGFIFARSNIQPNPSRDVLAIAATKALGLDFGAVDIIEDKHGSLYVLEVNTAPGLEGQTITNYANAFRGIAENATG